MGLLLKSSRRKLLLLDCELISRMRFERCASSDLRVGILLLYVFIIVVGVSPTRATIVYV